MSERDRVLLFGVGATKAGTSWLYRYLREHPDCHFRSVKELHYFDTRSLPKFRRRMKSAEEHLSDQLKRLEGVQADKRADAERAVEDAKAVIAMLPKTENSEAAYLDYLTSGAGAGQVVGDITPAYSLLKARALRRMSRLTDNVRFLYIVRDPVARLWSHIRMMARWAQTSAGDLGQTAAEILSRLLNNELRSVMFRSDYAGALKRLNKGVASDRLCVLFFEELFSDKATRKICRFLGISEHSGCYERVVHAGVKLQASAADTASMQRLLAPQYAAVKNYMGRVPAAWQKNMVEV